MLYAVSAFIKINYLFFNFPNLNLLKPNHNYGMSSLPDSYPRNQEKTSQRPKILFTVVLNEIQEEETSDTFQIPIEKNGEWASGITILPAVNWVGCLMRPVEVPN